MVLADGVCGTIIVDPTIITTSKGTSVSMGIKYKKKSPPPQIDLYIYLSIMSIGKETAEISKKFLLSIKKSISKKLCNSINNKPIKKLRLTIFLDDNYEVLWEHIFSSIFIERGVPFVAN